VSPQMRREAVLVMQVEVEMSQRRACGLMEVHRATCRYQRRRSEDGPLRERLRALAEERRRFGYRRLRILLVREGWQVNLEELKQRRGLPRQIRSDNGPEFLSRAVDQWA